MHEYIDCDSHTMCQCLTFLGHVFNEFVLRRRHVAQVAEDDDARKQTSETVYTNCGDAVPENVKICTVYPRSSGGDGGEMSIQLVVFIVVFP